MKRTRLTNRMVKNQLFHHFVKSLECDQMTDEFITILQRLQHSEMERWFNITCEDLKWIGLDIQSHGMYNNVRCWKMVKPIHGPIIIYRYFKDMAKSSIIQVLCKERRQRFN